MAPLGITGTMPRSRGAWFVLTSRPAVIGFVLSRFGPGPLSFGPRRFAPPPPDAFPDGTLGAALRPHQRRLWRTRALHTLTRTLLFAAGWLLVAALIARAMGKAEAPLFWIPILCCLPAGLWLAFAQRPTALETARMLDRRFRLRDVLGTAVEISSEESDTQLYHKQIASAMSLLNRVPPSPWAPAPRREWLLIGGLAAIGCIILAGTAHQVTSIVAATHGKPGAASGVRPLTLAQSVGAPRAGNYPGINQPGASTSCVTTKARIPSLSLSLQIHAAAQGDQSSTVGANPYLTGGALGSGKSGGTAGKGAQGAKGTAGQGSGAGQGQQGGSGGSPQGGAGQQGTAGQGQNGQGQNGLQAPQSGQQNTAGQSGQAGGAQQNQNQNQDPTTNQGGQQPNSAGTNSGAPTGANPFGKDQPPPGSKSSGTRQTPQNGKSNQPKQSPGATNPKGGAAGGKGSGQAPNGDNLPDGLRRGKSGARPSLNQQPSPATHKAGPATGPQVSLGGHYVITPGEQGQGLVRIAPQGAAAGNGGQGADYAGSATVQGYVPEDSTALSPEEQALVRAYFSGEGN
jgi:hypothetical protein